jgi:hypothetical protein
MNKIQENKVVQLRAKGLGYRRIANNIKGVNREQVRYLINSNRFKEKHPELVDTDNSIANKGLEKRIKYFKNKFENKFPDFEYHSGYTGTDDYFKMKCRKCGHIQKRNAQCARPSRKKKVLCDKCEEKRIETKNKKEKINKIINLIRDEVSNRREHIKPEVAALKRISKNHRYYGECDRCGRHYFTNRSNSVHCDRCIDKIELEKTNRISNWKGKYIKCKECGKRFEMRSSKSKFCSTKCSDKNYYRVKELRRRKKLQENGRVNYKISKRKLIEREGSKCKLCGEPVDFNDYHYKEEGYFIAGPKYPSIDHIIPVAKGGTHTWDNVQLAHRHCNSVKSDSSALELDNNRVKISI